MRLGFYTYAGVSFRTSTGSAGTDGGEDEEEAKGGGDSRFAIVSVRSRSRAYRPSAVDVVVNDESKKLRTVSLSEPARESGSASARGEEYRNLALSRFACRAGEPGSRGRVDAPTSTSSVTAKDR